MTNWEHLKTALNRFPTGATVSRKEIMTMVKFSKNADSTLDKYRYGLMKAGYLEETGTRGLYRVKKKIPANLTSFDVDQFMVNINK